MKEHPMFKCPEGDEPCTGCLDLIKDVPSCWVCSPDYYCERHLGPAIAALGWGLWLKVREEAK